MAIGLWTEPDLFAVLAEPCTVGAVDPAAPAVAPLVAAWGDKDFFPDIFGGCTEQPASNMPMTTSVSGTRKLPFDPERPPLLLMRDV